MNLSKKSLTSISYIYVLAGASLWGLIGLFTTYLSEVGFTSLQMVAIRCIGAMIILAIIYACLLYTSTGYILLSCECPT